MKNLNEYLNECLEIESNNNDQLNESEIKDEKEFREYAEKMLKEAHGDDYDADKAKEMIDGILEDNKELVEENKWGELVGILQKGITKED